MLQILTKGKRIFLGILLGILLLPAHTEAAASWHAKTSLHIVPSVAGRGYSPDQIRSAYHIGAQFTGKGSKVAIVDAFIASQAAHDLEVFSQTYHLPLPYGLPSTGSCSVTAGPHPCFQVISQATFSDTGWATETDLDVQWAHAIAPQADLLLISAKNDTLPALLKAVDTAVQFSPQSVSMSWGGNEFKTEGSDISHFTSSKTQFVASAGDAGSGVLFPAVLPTVIGVGGTSLTLHGAQKSETAWVGSGGGVSKYLSQPSFQSGVIKNVHRTVPDAAYDADPTTGFAIYSAKQGWMKVGGTSAGAPQWAALLADLAISPSVNVFSRLYTTPTGFQDVVSGKNGACAHFCQAHTGYDTVTGLGTPNLTQLSTAF